jgi:monoamine oxidase
MVSRSSRTPLFAALRRALRLAVASTRPGAPPVRELVEISRRRFIAASAAAAGLTMVPSCRQNGVKPDATGPRIAIVGAGIAGLNCAYKLKQAGLRAEVFEGSKRVGGRMFSGKDVLAPGLVTELGGEFIDSGHQDMMDLCKEFGLQLWDVESLDAKLKKEAFFFDGKHYTEAEVVEAFRPLAPKIQADAESLGDGPDYENPGNAGPLDRTSIAAYLDRLGASGWLRKLLDVAFVTEYGLETGDQSSLNFITMISTDVSEGKFEPFGESDERYKVEGGNQRVCLELSARVREQIRFEQRLEAVWSRGSGFALTFKGPQGTSTDVQADFVVLAIPFTLLRAVDVRVEMPDFKKKAIAELGYGNNSKVMVGMKQRVWNAAGFRGNIFSDEPFQLAWDSSMCQPGAAGGMTCYSGGNRALEVGGGTPDEQAARLAGGLDKAWPGFKAAMSGKNARMHWPTYPFSKAAYACYRPGQWTTICGAEGAPVGNLLFAGEHCSGDFQGFMNGGAETGRVAAEALLALVRPEKK